MPHITTRLVALVTAVSMAMPAQAVQEPYFRMHGTFAVPEAGSSTPPGMDVSIGELAFFSPKQVRARPGLPFVLQFSALYPKGSVSWASIGASLPDGLTLTADGLFSGTPSTVGSWADVVIQGTDGSGATGKTRPFAIDVKPLPAVAMEALYTLAASANATLAPTATDVYGSQSWTLDGPSLPVGMSFDPKTGAIAGSPEQKGLFEGYVLRVVDADGAAASSEAFSIRVNSNLSVAGMRTDNSARLNEPMTPIQPYVTGVTGGSSNATWTLLGDATTTTGAHLRAAGPALVASSGTSPVVLPSSGAVPAWLAINPKTGNVSGTPDARGYWPNLYVRVTDGVTGESVVSRFSVRVGATPQVTVPPMTVSRPDYNGRTYASIVPKATDILGKARWDVVGRLPDGFNLDTATGVVTGYAYGQDTLSEGLTLRATDMFDGAQGFSNPFAIWLPPRLTVGDPPDVEARLDKPFRLPAPQARGLIGTGSLALNGTLPKGLGFDAATGEISGTPTELGRFRIFYGLTDSVDGARATSDRAATLTVSLKPALSIVSPNYPTYPAVVDEAMVPIVARQSGGDGPFEWKLEGSLPSWASYDAAKLSIVGTPTEPGTWGPFSFVVTDTADGHRTEPTAFYIEARNPAFVGVGAVPVTATQYAAYGPVQPTVTGKTYGPPIVTLDASSAPLPDGLVFRDGVFKGAPNVSGIFPGIVLKVRDDRHEGVSKPIAITVVRAAYDASMRGLAVLTGDEFSQAPSSRGLLAPLKWVLAADSAPLPAFAKLDPDTGALSGKAGPEAVRHPGIRLKATDARGNIASTGAFDIVVQDAVATVEGGIVKLGKSRNYVPSVSRLTANQTWTLAGGRIPDWAKLDARTGTISATPTDVGTYEGITLRVTDDTGRSTTTNVFSVIALEDPPLGIVLGDVPGGTTGVAYDHPVKAENPLLDTEWSSSGNAMPPGLRVDTATGRITGIPQKAGVYEGLRLSVNDGERTKQSEPFAIAVGDGKVVVTGVAPDYSIETFSGRFETDLPTATGNAGTVTWALVGTLPEWAAFRKDTGVITAAPTVETAPTSLILSATDAAGQVGYSQPFTLSSHHKTHTVAVTLSKQAYAPMARDASFATVRPTVTGAVGTVAWESVGPALPDWVKVDAATGIVSGTPPKAAPAFAVTLKATDQANGTGLSPAISIEVKEPAIAVSGVEASYVRRLTVPLTAAAVADGGTAPYAWSLTGGAPTWLTADKSTGALSGTPDAVGGPYALRLTATDALGFSKSLDVSVEARPGVKVSGLASLYTLRAKADLLKVYPDAPRAKAENLLGAPSWTGAGLPTGIAVGPDGGLTGSPAVAGDYDGSVRATDAADGAFGAAAARFKVLPALAVTGVAGSYSVRSGSAFRLPLPGIAGVRGSVAFTAAGPYPTWAKVDPSTGAVNGTSGAPGSYKGLAIHAADSADGAVADSATFALDVLEQPAVTNMATAYTARFGFAFAPLAPKMLNGIGLASWSWRPGSAPPAWLRLDPATGALTGTPDTLGKATGLVLTATDASDGAFGYSVPFTVETYAAPQVTLASNLHRKRVGDGFSAKATTQGFVGSPVFSMVATQGIVPAGLSIDPATGEISGTLDAAGDATVVIVAKDPNDGFESRSEPVTFIVREPLAISGLAPSYKGRKGNFLSLPQPLVDNAMGSVAFTLGGIPAGLSLAASTGILSGDIGAVVPASTLTLTATDPWDGNTAKLSFEFSAVDKLGVAGIATVDARYGKDIAIGSFVPTLTGALSPASVTWTKAAGVAYPPGIDVDPGTGVLVGTAPVLTAAKTYAGLAVMATDSDGAFVVSDAFSIVVSPPLTLSYATLAYATKVGVTQVLPVPSIGGQLGSIAWSVVTDSGTAPPSVSVATTGAVSYRPDPASVGTWRFHLRGVDSRGKSAADTQVVTATISPAPYVTMANISLRSGAPGFVAPVPTVDPKTARAPLKWTSTYPGTGTTNQATGAVTVAGTAPSATSSTAGPYTMTLTDADGAVGTATFSVTFDPAPVMAGPSDYFARTGTTLAGPPVALAPALGNVTYAAAPSVYVSGASTACAALPTGFSVDPSTGVLTGNTAANMAGANLVTGACIKGTDDKDGASNGYRFNIKTGAPLAMSSLPASTRVAAGSPYYASGTVSNAYGTLKVSAAGLPSGLGLTQNGASWSVVGTLPANAVGDYAFTLTALDAWDGSSVSTSTTVSVVQSVALSYPKLTTVTQGSDVASLNLAPSLSNLNGAASYAWVIQPQGWVLDPATGVISGIHSPSVGNGSFSVRVSDGGTGSQSTYSGTFSTATDATAFTVAIDPAQAGTAFQPLSFAPTATVKLAQPNQAVSWALAGSLPNGLAFDPLTGRVSGTPTAASTTTLRFKAYTNGMTATTEPVTLTIADRVALKATVPGTSYDLRRNVAFSLTPSTADAMGTVRWEVVDGRLPNGMAFDDVRGTVSGSPLDAGTYAFALKAYDQTRSATTESVTLRVGEAFAVTTSVVSTRTRVGLAYRADASADGAAAPVAWRLESGLMPQGLTLDAATGRVAGVPTADGSTVVTLRATDAQGATATGSLTVTVGKAPSVRPVPSQFTAFVGGTADFVASASNAPAPLAWSIVGSAPGIGVDAASGGLNGSATTVGDFTGIVLKVTDADGLSALSTPFTVSVTSPSDLAVRMPPALRLPRGEPMQPVRPGVSGAVGAVTYKLQAYAFSAAPPNSCGNLGTAAWYDLGSLNSQCSGPNFEGAAALTSLPDGLAFDPATGAISGTLLGTSLLPTGAKRQPFGYRVVASESRAGGRTAMSEAFSFAVQDWPPFSVTAPGTVQAVQGKPIVPLVPTVTGATGPVAYKLQTYAFSAAFPNGCSNVAYGWFDLGSLNPQCSGPNNAGAAALTSLPDGLSFDAATGTISGTMAGTSLIPTGANRQPQAYRVVATETRAGGQSVSAASGEIVVTVAPWTLPSVQITPKIDLTRLVPMSAGPVLTGATGAVSYKLQVYTTSAAAPNACANVNSGWFDLGSLNSQCSGPNFDGSAALTSLPDGLAFDPPTGTVSGVPTGGSLTPAGAKRQPLAYRVVATETRAGQVLTANSNQFTFGFQDWSQPLVSVPSSVPLTRGQPMAVTPTVTGATGAVAYKLQTYAMSAALPNGCSSVAWGWFDLGSANSQCSGANFDGAAALTSLPDGLSFDPATGTISGIPTNGTLTPTGAKRQPVAYRVVATETRAYGNQTASLVATSRQIAFTLTDWTPNRLSLPASATLVPGGQVSLYPTVEGPYDSVSYKLQAYTVSAADPNVCGRENWGWFDLGSNNPQCATNKGYGSAALTSLPDGLAFDPATGAVSGVFNGTSLIPTGSPRQPAAYHVIATVVRSVNGVPYSQTLTSNSLTFALGGAAAATLSYGGILKVRIGDAVRFKPSLANASSASSFAGTFLPIGSPLLPTERHANAFPNYLPTGLSLDPASGDIYGTVQPGAVTWTQATRSNASAIVALYRGLQVCATTPSGKACQAEVPIQVVERDAPSVSAPQTVPGTVGTPLSMGATVGGKTVGTLTYSLLTQQGTAVAGDGGELKPTTQPPGLNSLSTTAGTMSGTPTAAGTYRGYAIRVVDAQGYVAETEEISFKVSSLAPLSVSSTQVRDVQALSAMADIQPVASNTVGTVTWTLRANKTTAINGQGNDKVPATVPAWLKSDTATGRIWGTPPLDAGGFDWRGFAACANDSRGVEQCSGEIAIRVAAYPDLAVTVPSTYVAMNADAPSQDIVSAAPSNVVGTFAYAALAVSQTTAVDNQNGERVLGTLPGGFGFSTATGRITGAPLATTPSGRYRGYKICGTDSGRTTPAACSGEIIIEILPRPAFTLAMPGIVSAKVGQPLGPVLPIPLGQSGAVTYGAGIRTGQTTIPDGQPDLNRNALPGNVTYSTANGSLSGTPAAGTGGTKPGTPQRWRGYQVCATDALGRSACTDEVIISVMP